MVLSFIYGPMTSGKTTRLLKSYKLAKRYRLGTSIIKPATDNRAGPDAISTHDGKFQKADVYVLGQDRFPPIKKARMIFVDEAQFLSIEEVNYIINKCDKYNTSFCIFFGLMNDYADEPFESSEYIASRAHIKEELFANCAVCDDQAIYTQRLVNRMPAPFGEKVLVGGAEQYEARCEDCYVHPSIVEELL